MNVTQIQVDSKEIFFLKGFITKKKRLGKLPPPCKIGLSR